MITVEFHGYSDDNQHIEETRIKVENSFFLEYTNSECETMIFEDEEEFKFVFNGDWDDVEDLDEDIIKNICHSHELYGHVCVDNEMNKSYYFDEDDEFVYR